MPTLSGMRRRGIPPEAIRDFIGRLGISKSNATVEMANFEACVREALNPTAERRLAVLNPLKVVIENYPEGQTEELEGQNNPADETAGTRMIPFSREIYIERDDFMEDPPKKFFRMSPSQEVRLRYAYFVTCTDVIKDASGEVVELRCTYDPATRGGNAPDGRKVKATIHWVSAQHAAVAEVRMYEHLFDAPEPGAKGDMLDDLDPDSLTVLSPCYLEPSLADLPPGQSVQFERLGYFCADPDSGSDGLIFNRTLGLRDNWAKIQAKDSQKA